jgi:hypothetical protein
MNVIRLGLRATARHVATTLMVCLAAAPGFVHAEPTPKEADSGTSGGSPDKHTPRARPASSRWQVALAYRHFQARHHFIGDVRQTYREREGSQTINEINLFDLGITYAFSSRLRATLTIPFADDSRSQVVRSPSGAILDRFATSSSGLRDVRFLGDLWLRDPGTQPAWNVSLGTGLLVPTGDDAVRDVFEIYDRASGRLVTRQQPVDTSIQLGSGGWGIILRSSAYAVFSPPSRAYFDATYVVTPQDTNGVATFLPNPYERVISIADSYLARTGIEYKPALPIAVTASLGLRFEGVPVHDLIGRSDGFRRPGYILSVEPGVSVPLGAWSVNMLAPVAVYRNRLQSVADKELTAATGVYTHGDAIYQDFSLIVSVSMRW